jgi:nucleotide-binding universal stress UspA family protein
MPIQRVFSAKGHGTVVTGIPVSGAINLGDPVEVLPAGLAGKIRGIQAYQRDVDRARAGHSSALNVTDLAYKSVECGMAVCAPGVFASERFLEASVWPAIRYPGAETVIRRGRSAAVIVNEVAQWRADLVVVGSHGKGWVDRLLIGSTSERLLHLLPTLTLVVPVAKPADADAAARSPGAGWDWVAGFSAWAARRCWATLHRRCPGAD